MEWSPMQKLNRLTCLALFLACCLLPIAARAERATGARLAGIDFLNQGYLVSFSGNYLAARSAIISQDIPAAADYFDRAHLLDPENRELLARAFLLHLSSGDIGRAAELATVILDKDKNDRLSRFVLAVRALRNQRYKTARELLEGGSAGADSDITAGLLSAWAAQGAGDTAKALDILSKLKGADWYDVFRNFHGGLIADVAARRLETSKKAAERTSEEAKKWRGEATRQLLAAYKADPYGLRLMEAEARSLARQGEKDQAIAVLDDFLSRNPENPIAKSLKADIEGKRAVAPLVRDARRGAAEVLLGLGSALARDDGQDIAAIYFNLAVYIDDDNGLALLSLADLMDQMKRPERAVTLYERVPHNSPMRRAADLQEALALDDLGESEKALLSLDNVLKTNPRDVDALVSKGNILRVKKRFGEAASIYDAAIAAIGDVQPRQWSLYFFRGISLEREKKWDLAERDLRHALELQPERPEVLNYLGYSLVDRHEKLDEALTMLHRAVELRPDDGYVIDSVGWAYYRLGNYEEALKWLERAIEKKPGDPVINDHLGDIFYRLGRTLEARFQWSHARDLNPEPEDLAVISEKLRSGELPNADAATPSTTQAGTPGQGG